MPENNELKPDYRHRFTPKAEQPSEGRDIDSLARFVSGVRSFTRPYENAVLDHNKNFSLIVDGTAETDESESESAADSPTQDIPAGYTYFGQFIDHDISRDSRSDRGRSAHLPFGESRLDSINEHSPSFNLQHVYGLAACESEGGIPEHIEALFDGSELPLFRLGLTRMGANDGPPFDLWRDEHGRAIVPDDRSDSNLILAQMHLLFMKLHNALVAKMCGDSAGQPREVLFNRARRQAVRIYQRLILNDYLPRICRREIIDFCRPEKKRLLDFSDSGPYIPFEFSAAAFRFGHSMIRNNYRLNDTLTDAGTRDIQMQVQRGAFGGSTATRLALRWAIDWRNFFEFGDDPRPQFAETIDTRLAGGISPLMPGFVGAEIRSFSLAALDLYRGIEKQLLPGQAIAEYAADYCGLIEPVSEERIRSVFTDARIAKDPANFAALGDQFCRETPLWFYVLAEAEIQSEATGAGKQLGMLGSLLVWDTIAALIETSCFSILKTPDEDDDKMLPHVGDLRFGDLLRFIEQVGNDHYEILYGKGTPYEKIPRFNNLVPQTAQ